VLPALTAQLARPERLAPQALPDLMGQQALPAPRGRMVPTAAARWVL
jgi:hypothetical protein